MDDLLLPFHSAIGYFKTHESWLLDPNEWLDFDEDGVGKNADADDDNDGMPDAWEAFEPIIFT